MRNLNILALGVLLISLAVAPAYAKRHGCGCLLDNDDEKGSAHIERIKQELDMTEQQEVDFKRIHTASKEETAPLRTELKANREAIHNTFETDPLDEARLRELNRKQAELKSDIMISKHTMRNEIDQILTPEQQEKHKGFHQKRRVFKGHRSCEGPANCRNEM